MADALYQVHSEIFSGVDPVEFRRYVVDSSAEFNRVALYRTAGGEPVGYCAIHIFEDVVEGRTQAIVRSEVGFLRAYRGQAPAGRFVARVLLAYRLRHPGRPMSVFACPVHPASYLTVARRAVEFWPRFDQATPPDVEQRMFALADRFGLKGVDPAEPYVRHVGWTTRSTAPEQAYWATCELPEVEHYRTLNPGYVDGRGLLLLVPMSTGMMVHSISRFFASQGRRAVSRWQARADAFTGGRSVDLDTSAHRLAATPLFADVPESACRELAVGARQLRVDAGRWVFQRGDRGDALYIVTEGSAHVLLEDSSDVVNQLGPGDVFGEASAVTGTPRSAGVRAVKLLGLLRIAEASLSALVDAHPEVGPALWHNVARMQYDNFMRNGPDEPRDERAARLATFERGRDLGAGFEGPGSGPAFVYHGDFELLSDGGKWRVSAPALVPAGHHLRGLSPDSRVWSLGPSA